MTLRELLSSSGVSPAAVDGDALITGICSDSRKATPGCLFVCMPSKSSDSHSFQPAAKSAGAVAVIVHSPEGFEAARALGLAVAQLGNDGSSFNSDLCKLCNVFFGYPTRNMKVVGVTGTNGKTTTAWLIRDMLRALGLKAAYLGTLGFQLPITPKNGGERGLGGEGSSANYDIEERELANTTPFPVELYTMLAEARDRGVEALAMEVSSHALEERRCEYVEFDVGVFTNLTQDHLDFHGTMKAYQAAKLRLFTELPKQTAKQFVSVVNVDDASGGNWVNSWQSVSWVSPYVDVMYATPSVADAEAATNKRLLMFGKHVSELDLTYDVLDVAVDSLKLKLRHLDGAEARVPLGGSYNVENCLSSSAAVLALGYPLANVARALERARPVPGRFEAVPNDEGLGILVDYAHTPDAIEKLLDAVRPLAQERILTVFGCGGDRDKNKRPKMAKSASERSDITVITSDNPRTEDPQAIIDEILPGIVAGKEHVAILDRREAVAYAIEIAKPGDVVVIAGKGHENYQIIGRTKHPMDDRELAREGLRRRKVLSVEC
ncbi:MAG: UDP-N-acetylmuramoyl-L-alanyl-D-glutamate--2,6-diaminopimelate ligase [Fimbriimonadaceae bacterium]